jgi:hypothetical protein
MLLRGASTLSAERNLLNIGLQKYRHDRSKPRSRVVAATMSVELFRYRGAAKDGGTLEYVFEAGEQNSPNGVTKEKVVEIGADFMTTFFLPHTGRRVGDSGMPHDTGPILARLFFGHHQGATPTIVLCRAAAGWNSCCAEGGEAAVVITSALTVPSHDPPTKNIDRQKSDPQLIRDTRPYRSCPEQPPTSRDRLALHRT